MEDSWDDLVSYREMIDGEDEDDDFFNQSHMSSFNEEEFLRDIIIDQSVFSPENDNMPSPNNPSSYNSPMQNKFVGSAIADPCGVATSTSTTNSGLFFDETNLDGHGTLLKSSTCSNNLEKKPSPLSPTCYILSFDGVDYPQHNPALVSSENRAQDHCIELPNSHQRTKKARNSSASEVHIMAERKRRQELTKSIVALSSTIPSLKKKDKAHVVREAVNYVKELEGRVRVLENQNRKKYTESVILMKKTQLCIKEGTDDILSSCDGRSGRNIEELPEVEATVLQKEVLIGIHCHKQKQSFLKILTFLNHNHLSVTSTSVLPFGTSTVKITTIAQMGEEYNMTNDDLVKTLRQHLLNLKSEDMQKTICDDNQ